MPPAFIADELEWSSERVKKAIADATALKLLYFSEYEKGWFFLPYFLEWNPIVNRNQWIGLKKLLDKVPQALPFYPELIKNILYDVKFIPDDDRFELENLFKGCRDSQKLSTGKPISNPSKGVLKPISTQEQEQYQE